MKKLLGAAALVGAAAAAAYWWKTYREAREPLPEAGLPEADLPEAGLPVQAQWPSTDAITVAATSEPQPAEEPVAKPVRKRAARPKKAAAPEGEQLEVGSVDHEQAAS